VLVDEASDGPKRLGIAGVFLRLPLPGRSVEYAGWFVKWELGSTKLSGVRI